MDSLNTLNMALHKELLHFFLATKKLHSSLAIPLTNTYKSKSNLSLPNATFNCLQFISLWNGILQTRHPEKLSLRFNSWILNKNK